MAQYTYILCSLHCFHKDLAIAKRKVSSRPAPAPSDRLQLNYR